MEEHKVVKEFEYKGRRCVIILIDRSKHIQSHHSKVIEEIYAPYHNGYIEMKEGEIISDYMLYDIKSQEITYQGDLQFKDSLDASDGKTYIGFDTAHYDDTPETKTAEYVEKQCIAIVDELEAMPPQELEDEEETTNTIIQASDIQWIVDNWDNIPDKFKENLKPNTYSGQIKDLKMEEHIAILLLDRQRPSQERNYDFDEERIGITRTGKIIWGFDSGCSCPSPWDDRYPQCYDVEKTWKEFEIKAKTSGDSDRISSVECPMFDENWQKTANERIAEIKKAVERGN